VAGAVVRGSDFCSFRGGVSYNSVSSRCSRSKWYPEHLHFAACEGYCTSSAGKFSSGDIATKRHGTDTTSNGQDTAKTKHGRSGGAGFYAPAVESVLACGRLHGVQSAHDGLPGLGQSAQAGSVTHLQPQPALTWSVLAPASCSFNFNFPRK